MRIRQWLGRSGNICLIPPLWRTFYSQNGRRLFACIPMPPLYRWGPGLPAETGAGIRRYGSTPQPATGHRLLHEESAAGGGVREASNPYLRLFVPMHPGRMPRRSRLQCRSNMLAPFLRGKKGPKLMSVRKLIDIRRISPVDNDAINTGSGGYFCGRELCDHATGSIGSSVAAGQRF